MNVVDTRLPLPSLDFSELLTSSARRHALEPNENNHRAGALKVAAAIAGVAQPGSTHPTRIVADEPEWRVAPQGPAVASSPRAIATRWRAVAQRTQETGAETADGCHVVKIILQNMNIRLSAAERMVQDGVVTPGMYHVTEPAVAVRCLFRGPYDVLHLHIPDHLIAECARDLPVRRASLCSDSKPVRDTMIERLGRALLDADKMSGSLGHLYADCISIAIIARLLARSSRTIADDRPKVAELARWRLKRAIEYVEAHLAEPVGLAAMASATGLTRMHFAAQFRAATGLRPHEYLLRRRIERAQGMLVGSDASVVDVALAVGFQTQAHFTSVFNKYVGQPPRAWRLAQDSDQPNASAA